ncbi:unnamed protein product [Acanthoscelides obtectus]|uniref:Uncharacterized protein n=1 Tax=Acanthoscelides obtectus TaxID=200917 RepID=A0A9P0VRE5_ACAOB|nr:unnamed protein product [Acanthoscelides obtectus]CAK1687478.1 hypothetical protein AOBTE_LOCUS36262 [Acanthoscelides obtectus]
MISLRELSLKKVAECVKSIVTFTNVSPLPWTLTVEVIKCYANFKWTKILLEAHDNPLTDILIIQAVEHTREIPSETHRKALLCQANFEDIYIFPKYCVWVNICYIPEYNLRLCWGCCNAFMVVLGLWNKKRPTVLRDHYHITLQVQEIHRLYRSTNMYCQNDFLELLLGLKDEYTCVNDLHNIDHYNNNHPYVTRFVDSGNDDSDIDF